MGTRTEVKIHRFISAKDGTRAGKTVCGIECWTSIQSEFEAETAVGNRVEITGVAYQVTCDKCCRGQ